MVVAAIAITVGIQHRFYRRLASRPILVPQDRRGWPADMSIDDVIAEAEMEGREQWVSDQRWNRVEERGGRPLP